MANACLIVRSLIPVKVVVLQTLVILVEECLVSDLNVPLLVLLALTEAVILMQGIVEFESQIIMVFFSSVKHDVQVDI